MNDIYFVLVFFSIQSINLSKTNGSMTPEINTTGMKTIQLKCKMRSMIMPTTNWQGHDNMKI